MEIIKRNGVIEQFLITKTEISISNCSQELLLPLTESDIKFLSNLINEKLFSLHRDTSPTSSYEVKGIVYKILCENGFKRIAEEYISK